MSDGARGPTGAIRDKLIAKKQDWAREGRLLTGRHGTREVDRLPPGQRLVRDWPVLDLGVQPDIPRERFRLIVDGAVENPVVLDWQGLTALPQSESVSDIHCVTAWSRYDNRWSGVRAADLLWRMSARAPRRATCCSSPPTATRPACHSRCSPARTRCSRIRGRARRSTGGMVGRCAW